MGTGRGSQLSKETGLLCDKSVDALTARLEALMDTLDASAACAADAGWRVAANTLVLEC